MEVVEQENPNASSAINVVGAAPSKAENMGGLSLIHLGYDILALIMEELRVSSPKTLAAVALTSSILRGLAQVNQHREINFDTTGQCICNLPWFEPACSPKIVPANNGPRISKRLDLIETRGLLPAVRHVRIRCDGSDHEQRERQQPDLNRLVALLPLMSGLTDLSWTGSARLPDRVTHLLQSQPAIRLHFGYPHDIFTERDEVPTPRHNQAMSSLTGLVNLTSLSVWHILPLNPHETRVMPPLKQLLLTCPNLSKLRLRIPKYTPPGFIHRSWRGLTSQRFPRTYGGLGFTDGQRPAAGLRELFLENYPFGRRDSSAGGPNGQPFTAEDYPLLGDEEDYWAEIFDWSQLERLDTDNLKLAHRMMPELKSLREFVATNPSDPSDIIGKFVLGVPARLESITVASSLSIIPHRLRLHGASLRKLHMHRTERFGPQKWYDNALEVRAMQEVRDSCPHLEELSVDVRRDGEWPYDVLDIISSFPRLRSLMVSFELGLRRLKDPVEPYITVPAAQHLFKYTWDHSPTRPSPLRTMTISSGIVPFGGRDRIDPTYASNQLTTFVFTVSERDDEMSRGKHDFRVEGLSAEDAQGLLEGSTFEHVSDMDSRRAKRICWARHGPRIPFSDVLAMKWVE